MSFLPHRATIESYGDGGFRFAHLSHLGSLLVLPSGMHPWPVLSLGDITPKSFVLLLAEKNDIDFLLLGTGETMTPPPENLLSALAKEGVQVDWMATGSAVRTYNVVLAEKRRVAAALIAVDKAHG
jgi:uncharacterized protein